MAQVWQDGEAGDATWVAGEVGGAVAPGPTSFPHLAEAQGTGLSLEGVRRPGVRPQQAGPEGKVAFDEPGFGCWRGPGRVSPDTRAARPPPPICDRCHPQGRAGG